MNLSGDLNKSGTIASRKTMAITADNIKNLGGTLRADKLGLSARQDIDNIGGIGVSIGTRMQSSEQKFEQSGVTLALSSGLVSNLQSATKVVINRWWQYAPSPAWP